LTGRDHLGDLGVDNKITLKYILRKQSKRTSSGFKGPVAGCGRYGNDVSGSVEAKELF